MPFTKGHPPYPPKDGRTPGTTKAHARATRLLASEVRERVPPSAWVDYHISIACKRANVRWSLDEDDVPYVVWDERGGITPTQAEVTASINWLADRGHGMPVQSIHLEANLRASVVHAQLPTGALPLATILAIRRAISAGQPHAPALPVGEPEPSSSSSVLDATSTERVTVPVPDDER